jgi:F-type H+-transporting ATPase subunit epsilon
VRLEILQPFGRLATIESVSSIVLITPQGSYGLLPHRRDCAAVLAPGLLSYTTAAGEAHVATDAGVLTKIDDQVQVCVRRAIQGVDLGELHRAIEREFFNLSEQEKSARAALAQLESGLVRRLLELRRG